MIDPVTLAVIRGRLEQIVDEMDATLFRAAFSPVIAEARDDIARDPRTGMMSPDRAMRDYPITIAPDGSVTRNAA